MSVVPLVRRIPKVLGVAVIVAVLAGCFADRLYRGLQPTPIPNEPPPAGLASLSAQSCQPCHAEITEEWAGSGMATAYTDPVFQAKWKHEDNFYYCLSCHAPLEAQQPTQVTGLAKIAPLTAIESPNPLFSHSLQREGVTCVACHLKDGAMVGPHEVNAPHPVRVDPEFGEAKTCERCHQMPKIPFTRSDRPLSDTHAEWAEWKAVTGRTETCTDCHMPAVERQSALGGPVRESRRHTFPGAWDDDFVRSALDVSEPTLTDQGVEITLTNRAGHRLPSGEPGRALLVNASFRDASGEELASVEQRIERRVKMPSGRDLGDNTLLPGETRTIPFEAVLPEPAAEVVVTIIFDRLANIPSAHDLNLKNRSFELAYRRVSAAQVVH